MKNISRITYSSAFIALTLTLLHFTLKQDNNDIIAIQNTETLEITEENNEELTIEPVVEELGVKISEEIESEVIEPEIILEDDIIDNRKLVALTFDDGPSKYTEDVIELLNKYDVKATFFVLKTNCKNYPDSLIVMAENGHEIAIHGATHTSFNKLSNSGVEKEITSTIEYIDELGVSASNIVRPPYMQYSKNLLQNTNYPFILWNIDTNDWKHHNTEKIKKEILDNIDDGSIILMHDRADVYNCDIKALEEILPELVNEYKFVTISELADSYDTNLEAGKVYKKIKNPNENKN